MAAKTSKAPVDYNQDHDQKLKALDYGTGIYKEASYYAVKAPVFSFEKLTDVDTGRTPR